MRQGSGWSLPAWLPVLTRPMFYSLFHPDANSVSPPVTTKKVTWRLPRVPRGEGRGAVGPAGEPPAHRTNIYSDQRATFPASRPRTRHATFYAVNLPSPGLQNGESQANPGVSGSQDVRKTKMLRAARDGAQPASRQRPPCPLPSLSAVPGTQLPTKAPALHPGTRGSRG